MSLLADLLSKNKREAENGEENPARHDIPPTLSKAHEIPAKVPRRNRRYIAVSALIAALLATGALIIIKYSQVNPPAAQKTASRTAQQGSSFQADTSPRPTGPATTTPGQAAESPVARIILEEPAALPPRRKIAVAPEVPSPQTVPQRHRIQTEANPASGAAPKRGREPRQESVPARQKTVAPPKIDTAARDALLYAARSAERSADWKSALASYRKAQEIDPGNYKIMSNVAAAFNNLGMFNDGILEAERALGKKPDYVPALINAAVGYSSKGNTQKALRLFSYASALDPGNRDLTINLGIMQERSGKLDEAQLTYRQLANTDDPLALQGMARIYELKKNKSEAARTCRRILKLPNASAASKKEARLELERLKE
jgi:tetratricopeptide (TPR) repeat protein